MKLIQGIGIFNVHHLDLVRKRKLYQILSMIFIISDLIAYISMESLDITFSIEDEDYGKKLITFVLKVNFFHIKDYSVECFYCLFILNANFEIFEHPHVQCYCLFSHRGDYFLLHVHRRVEIV
jgi:hypothetical protein